MNGTRTEAAGVAHVTTSYPLARTVGCSCGWTRVNVHADIHDDLIEAHLASVTR